MSKTSAKDGDGDEMAQSELARGGYFVVYYKLALNNYLLHLSS